MKKAPAILLLVLILYQLVGYYSFHQLQVYQIKKEIKKKIKNSVPQEELVSFTFTFSEVNKIQWVKKDKEFIFEGEMYDVVKVNKAGNTVTFHCIADFKETALFAQLSNYVNQFLATHPDQQKKNNQLFKRFNPDYFYQKASLLAFYKENCKKTSTFIINKKYLVVQQPESPPPRFI